MSLPCLFFAARIVSNRLKGLTNSTSFTPMTRNTIAFGHEAYLRDLAGASRHNLITSGFIWIAVVVKNIPGFVFISSLDDLFEVEVKMDR